MRTRLVALLGLAAVSAAFLPNALAGAADPATEPTDPTTSTITVIHGIPGEDIGANNALPVDVEVNGACALTGFVYQDVSPRLQLPAGTYDIEVKLSDGACGGAVAIDAPGVVVPGGINATIVAHLDADGAPTASVFVNDLSAAKDGQARVAVHHLAAAPTVDIDVFASSDGGWGRIGWPSHPALEIDEVSNGDSAIADVPAIDFVVDLSASGAYDPVYSAPVNLDEDTYYAVYAVGNLAKGGFALLIDAQPLG